MDRDKALEKLCFKKKKIECLVLMVLVEIIILSMVILL